MEDNEKSAPSETLVPVKGNGEPRSRILLEWVSPLRVYKPLNRDNFRRLVVWSIILSLVLIFFKEFFLVLTIFALIFFSYVMGTVPPGNITTKVSQDGVTTAGHTYIWKELRDFYFTEKLGSTILNIRTHIRPTRLSIIIKDVSKIDVENTLSAYISHREEPPTTFTDNLTEKAAQLLNMA